MATFTSTQANNCTFNRCESFKIDGAHQYWVISVTDENGCSYEWRDTDMTGEANVTAIKAASKVTLMATEMKAIAPVKTVDSKDDILGDTIG